MSFRDHASNIMDNLIASGIWSAAIVLAVKFWPRIVATFTALRVAISSLPAALLRRLRALLRRRARVGQLTGISQGTSQSYGALTNATPEPMPPGTASAIAMAMQDPPQRPQFLNNSHDSNWQQAFAHQQQLEAAARFAMQASVRRYNHALTP